jgi:hypothetical protein
MVTRPAPTPDGSLLRTQSDGGSGSTSTEGDALTGAPQRHRPDELDAVMIGSPDLDMGDATPIFDSISAWFSTDTPAAAKEPVTADTGSAASPQDHLVIDLRDEPAAVGAGPAPQPTGESTSGAPGGNRWATLGDQRWIAANARAASTPTVAGNTEAGLPRRQPGANLLPSAAEAAPIAPAAPAAHPVSNPPSGGLPVGGGGARPTSGATGAPAPRPNADAVRGRLGSYQRGLSSARRARHLPGGASASDQDEPDEHESGPQDAGHSPADQGGDS